MVYDRYLIITNKLHCSNNDYLQIMSYINHLKEFYDNTYGMCWIFQRYYSLRPVLYC